MKINIFNKQKKFEEEVLSGEYAVGDMEYSSYYKDSFKRLKKNKMSMFCLFVILLLFLLLFLHRCLHHMIRLYRIMHPFYRDHPSSIYSVQMSMDEIFYPELFTELEFL